MNIEENPNYLVMSTDDYVKLIAKLVERAGISLGISGAIVTTGIVLMNESNANFIDAFYTYITPLLFVGVAFIAYAKAFTRSLTLAPYSFVYNLASQQKLQAQSNEELEGFKETFKTTKDRFRRKKHEVDFADGSFIVAILLSLIVNSISKDILREHLGTNPLIVAVLLIIIGALTTGLYYYFRKSVKPLQFAHTVHLVGDGPQLIPSLNQQNPQLQIVPQPAMPMQQTVDIQVTPEQLAEMQQVLNQQQVQTQSSSQQDTKKTE